MPIILRCMSQLDFLHSSFGQEPVIPIDLVFSKKQSRNPQSHVDYAERWKSSMQEAYGIAMKNMKKAAAKGQPEGVEFCIGAR